MKLIIGLGNPGAEYDNTRHNVGFAAVDAFAAEEDGVWKKDAKRKAETCTLKMGEETVILAKPTTFMNLSGEAASALASFYKVSPADILVIHDEMDLDPGVLRFKADGGAAGHNGIISIQEQTGTDKFARLRIGIGHPKQMAREGKDHVLSQLSPQETPNALDVIAGMRDWIEEGTEKAMNKWNRSKA
jgi:PTH1 family peptidyl-tRNA hydrolase